MSPPHSRSLLLMAISHLSKPLLGAVRLLCPRLAVDDGKWKAINGASPSL